MITATASAEKEAKPSSNKFAEFEYGFCALVLEDVTVEYKIKPNHRKGISLKLNFGQAYEISIFQIVYDLCWEETLAKSAQVSLWDLPPSHWQSDIRQARHRITKYGASKELGSPIITFKILLLNKMQVYLVCSACLILLTRLDAEGQIFSMPSWVGSNETSPCDHGGPHGAWGWWFVRKIPW